MNVGIMTMHRIKNYGSFLQAYGLKKLIEKCGHNTVFVDYNFEKSIVEANNNKIKNIFNTKNIIRRLIVRKKFNNSFNNIQREYFGDYNYNPNDIDELVIGSDEVFNCLQPYPVGYSRELFGKSYEHIPVISYAASCGQTSYDRLKLHGISDEVGTLLSKFKSISVRDNNSFNTVNKLTSLKPFINLDPVLIYDFKKEAIDNVKLKDYIIVYAYPNRLTKNEKKQIVKFAKKYNKKIVSFGMYQDISNVELVINPFEIFAYFKHADFVITDTFHGSIFAIKSGADFVTIIRNTSKGNSNKLSDLLERLSLSNRIIDNINDLESKYKERIEYSKTYNIINKEVKNTMKYLKNNL